MLIPVSKLKKGDYFKINESAKQVYVRGGYDSSTKKFCCCKFDDIGDERMLKGCKLVYVGFEF